MPRDWLGACYLAWYRALCSCVRRRPLRLAGEEHIVDLEVPVALDAPCGRKKGASLEREAPESPPEASWCLVGDAARIGHQRRGAQARGACVQAGESAQDRACGGVRAASAYARAPWFLPTRWSWQTDFLGEGAATASVPSLLQSWCKAELRARL